MKRILFAVLASFASLATVPPAFINPSGSVSGQAIVSTGPSTAPVWSKVTATALAAQAANTVVANVTGSSASPTAFAMPSCSTTSSALQYTSGTGFTCFTGSAPLASPTFTGVPAAPTAGAGTNTTQIATTAFATAAAAGRLVNVQIFAASVTYTPTTGAAKAIVCGSGGGGAGGGAPATGADTASIGGGGSAGAFGCIYISSGLSSQIITIGAGGSPGAAGASGGSGGATSFGALMSLPGGPGGGVGGPATGPFVAVGTGQSSDPSGSGTFLYSSKGAYSGFGIVASATSIDSGMGASGPFGVGGPGRPGTGGGSVGSGYGSGGGGAGALASQSAQTGAAGQGGFMIVYEYQ